MTNRESDPLLKDVGGKSYHVNAVDEEYTVSSDSSATTIDEHDAEYIVKNRLGEVSLFTVTLW